MSISDEDDPNKWGNDRNVWQDMLDAMQKLAEETRRAGSSFNKSRPYSSWEDFGQYSQSFRRWIERFKVEYRTDGQGCYRVTDLKTNIWLDVSPSAVLEEDQHARKTIDPNTDINVSIKRRAGKIAHAIIRYREKESTREKHTKIISVTYGPADRESDYCSPSKETVGESQEVAPDVYLLRASTGVT